LDIFGFESSETYATILEVKKNPGNTFIWIGFILATLGLIFSFYMVPQRLWMVLSEKADGTTEIVMGGTTAKNPDLFRQKFERWTKRLKG
jgi:cytochrome c biogenesis protein ResB